MALDNVIKAILDDGKKEVVRILSEGKDERNQAIKEARAEAIDIRKERNEEAERYTARLKTQEIARAEIDSKKLVLKAQKDALDNIYDSALKELGERWSGALIENSLKQNSQDVMDALVYSNERDRTTVEKLLSTYGGKFGGTIDCVGGIIIESKDRTVRIDYRLETVLKDIWDESVTDIASILWGEKTDG
jgi:V/A-type H+-transporting ATPase subunit E